MAEAHGSRLNFMEGLTLTCRDGLLEVLGRTDHDVLEKNPRVVETLNQELISADGEADGRRVDVNGEEEARNV